MTERTCPTCGTSFTPTIHNQRFCPPTPDNRARQKGQARSRCARAWDNAKQKNKLKQLIERGRVGSLPYNCAECNTYCEPGINVAPHASRFCGEQCKRRYHKRCEQGRRKERDLLAAPTRADELAFKRALKRDPCSYCGTTERGGIDHITPSANDGRDDSSNWTGCCQRCNAIKQDLPLLLALQWIPASRRYHDLRRAIHTPTPGTPE